MHINLTECQCFMQDSAYHPCTCRICHLRRSQYCLLSSSVGPSSDPILVEAVAICALFELYVHYVAPGTIVERQLYFQNLERRRLIRVNNVKHNKGSLRWFRVSYSLLEMTKCAYLLADHLVMRLPVPFHLTHRHHCHPGGLLKGLSAHDSRQGT